MAMEKLISKKKWPLNDPFPEVRAAGSKNEESLHTTAECLTWGKHIPYSKDGFLLVQIPKKSYPGHDKIQEMTHGLKLSRIDTAKDILNRETNKLLLEREYLRERPYHRREYRELGKAPESLSKLPSFTADDNFRFGKTTVLDESVHKIMYPSGNQFEAPVTGLAHSGEQKKHYGKQWKQPPYKESVEEKVLGHNGQNVKAVLQADSLNLQKRSTKFISTELSKFQERHFHALGKVFDPQRDTRHIPANYTFGVRNEGDSHDIYELIGNSVPQRKAKPVRTDAAGMKTTRFDDLDLQKQIIPPIGPLEDHYLARKITEEFLGLQLPGNQIHGVPTVRHPTIHARKGPRKLGDPNNYGDELGAKGLMYPTPGNIYSPDQIKEFESILACK